MVTGVQTETGEADAAADLPAGLARALVANSRDGLVVIGEDGTLIYVSPWADRMLGYERGETLGLDGFELVHPDDQVAALEGFESTSSTADSRPLPMLVRLARKDGTWLQAEIIGSNHLEDEHIRGLLLNVRDVSASMRTDEALRESELHHRMIVELAREGIWSVDPDGNTTFVNRAMAEMLDTTVSEMLQCTMFDFMDHEVKPEADSYLERRMSGVAEEHDFRLTTRLGRTVWTRMNTSPITDHSGAFRGAIALVTDITERRALEQRLAADARQDALTGVANRNALFESLGAKLVSGRLVAAFYIDLDDFKLVNDNYGHAVGDEVLRTVAARLSGAVRAGDIVARVGGDEFVVVSNALDSHDEARTLGRRIRDVVALPISLPNRQLEVAVSVGIGFANGADPDILLSDADDALYRAKRTGRGRVEVNEALSTRQKSA
jgi:diguanylate cyclase (GGDEF)-like protein/PAS domain S-box-containing protein